MADYRWDTTKPTEPGWYWFRGEISKNQIRLFLEGRRVLQAQDKLLTAGPGGIGLTPANGICIDDIVVRSLDTSPEAVAAAVRAKMWEPRYPSYKRANK